MKKKERPKSIPERIAGFFAHVTEAHVDAICSYAKITHEEFRDNIGAAKDLLPGLTPIYERAGVSMKGWWTTRPTNHIRAWAIRMMLEQRWIPETERSVRGHHDTKFTDGLETLLELVEVSLVRLVRKAAADFDISPESDYVVAAVNEAIEHGDVAVHQDSF